MIYDPANPAVAPGTPLSMANEAMFPHRATTTFDGLNTDPTVLSKALGMNVSPEIAAHIAPRIGQRFTRIQDNKPVILAHRTEGREITGGQMTGTVHGASTQPKNGVGHGRFSHVRAPHYRKSRNGQRGISEAFSGRDEGQYRVK